jgi:hypothetical protein
MIIRFYIMAFLGLLCSNPGFARSTAHGRAIYEVYVLSIVLEKYRADCGVYPDPEFWWAELTGMDAAIVNIGRTKYTDLIENLDPWGSPYQYSLDRSANFPIPRVYSYGRDKKSDTDGNDRDDIASWRDSAKVWKYYDPSFFTPIRTVVGLAVAIGYVWLLFYFHSKRVQTPR